MKLFTAKLCILAPLQHPPEGFEGLVHAHLFEKRKLILATCRRWARKGSPHFEQQLAAVIADIEQAYKDHITSPYAEDDCRECEQVITFIEEKMRFLTKKLKYCSSKRNNCAPVISTKLCTAADCSGSGSASCSCFESTGICPSCCSEAETQLPKAYARYCLGPKLLAKANRDLSKAQLVANNTLSRI